MLTQQRSTDRNHSISVRSIQSIALCAAGVFFSSSQPLHAEVALGSHGALALGLETGLTHSSNIFRNSDELDDHIFHLLPHLRYRFDQGIVRIDADLGVNMMRYDEFDLNDTEDIKSDIVIYFPHGESFQQTRTDFRLQAGYNEKTTPDDSVQDIVQTDEVNLSAIGRYYVSERTFLRFGGSCWINSHRRLVLTMFGASRFQ